MTSECNQSTSVPMYKCKYIPVIVLFFFQRSVAQQNNIWYFGHKAGLNFNASANQPVPSPLLNSAMDADEGCASISDEKGQILFYTNGITVYNRQDQVMLNGDSLAGNISAFQSSIVIPVPGNDSIFYIFTTDAVENGFANGYRYSIVNMNRDNGNGEVIVKNVLLWASCTERMCAARHANGIDIWLITNDNNSNIFRAWLITCNGIQTAAVASTTGVIMNQHSLTNTGAMKVSPDGKQLCQTHFPIFDEFTVTPNFCQLFDFDNSTGILSNARSIGFPDAQIMSCEFSPDSKLLYLARPNQQAIDQVENTLGTTAAILASRITIFTGNRFYGMQLGPDKKIYLSSRSSKSLGVINKPNVKGNGCNYHANQVSLANSLAYYGLPAFINDLSADPYNGIISSIVDSCSGGVQFNGQSPIPGPLQWDWDFGDSSTSNIQNPMHIFNPPDQVYTVKLKITSPFCGGVVYRSENIKPQGIFSNIDFDFNSSCNTYNVSFINKTPFVEDSAGLYTWEFGDGTISHELNPIHTYSTHDTFNVKLKLKTTSLCLDDSITHIVNLATFKVQASPDQTILVGQSINLNVNVTGTGNGKTYQWTPSTGLNNPTIKDPVAQPLEDIQYKITVTDNAGCTSEDSVSVYVMQLTDFYVPTGFTPNNDGTNDRIKPLYGKDLKLEEFSILNRWGQIVYTTHSRGEGWDGKVNNVPQNPGVFVWIIKAIAHTGVPYQKQGTFVLIR